MKKLKKNTGITLIALVITVIVLLILAGVSIAMLTGENGILTQAQRAKNETENAQVNEENTLASYEQYINASESGNTVFTDDAGKIAIIPKGFYIVPGLDDIDTGLVISDVENDTQDMGNQFVWIPVQTPVSTTEEEGTNNKAMAMKRGNNYRGLLYDFTESGSTVRNGCTTTSTEYREPDIIEDFDNNTSYNKGLFTKDTLQQEYNNMMESVEKYYGFYIGRYEIGIDGGTIPVSKNANVNTIITADCSNSNTYMWYGLYSKCKEFVPENSNNSVVSSMIWGSQYDAMLNWMQGLGEEITSINDTKKNTSTITGSKAEDNIRNIFDIYGCHYEWTLEAGETNRRINRGGKYNLSYSPSQRNIRTPDFIYDYYSSRIALYIK